MPSIVAEPVNRENRVDRYVDAADPLDGRLGREHPYAMITITEDGAAVLGLSLDGPNRSPAVMRRAEDVLEHLRREFSAPAGIAGTEMPPPLSRQQWEDEQAELRIGAI